MDFIQKDITTERHGLIIHGVNCQGVMGSGVALAIRNKWPVVYDEYKKHRQGAEALGDFQPIQVDDGLFVANCWTQEYYGKDGKIYASSYAIFHSLLKAFRFCEEHDLELLSPQIGCGLGGLNWSTDVFQIYHCMEIGHPEVDVRIFYI